MLGSYAGICEWDHMEKNCPIQWRVESFTLKKYMKNYIISDTNFVVDRDKLQTGNC